MPLAQLATAVRLVIPTERSAPSTISRKVPGSETIIGRLRISAPARKVQRLKAFSRGKATSRAPICNGMT